MSEANSFEREASQKAAKSLEESEVDNFDAVAKSPVTGEANFDAAAKSPFMGEASFGRGVPPEGDVGVEDMVPASSRGRLPICPPGAAASPERSPICPPGEAVSLVEGVAKSRWLPKCPQGEAASCAAFSAKSPIVGEANFQAKSPRVGEAFSRAVPRRA